MEPESVCMTFFYLSVFNLPKLKCLIQRYRCENEVTVWLTKIVCYNIHALFLRECQTIWRRTLGLEQLNAVSADISQGSDVNKHQGSINFNELVHPTHTVCADFNQGDESVFGSNAGKQCVTDLYISQ